MSSHSAVATTAVRGPLAIIQVPTATPIEGEVRVKVEWVSSGPLDLHQNDGGLLVNHPQILGDGIAGTVVEVGPNAKNLKLGDKVFGFMWREPKEKGQQEFITAPEYLLGKVPSNTTLQEAVTLPNNFVTVFHAVTKDLELPLPYPLPPNYKPVHVNSPILIWGGSSSAGQYAIQILSYWGYKNLLTTSSIKHHDLLKSFGAKQVFGYRSTDIVDQILEATTTTTTTTNTMNDGNDPIFVIDCIGSKFGSLDPISRIVKGNGARVAVLLPVVVRDATVDVEPVYSMDVQGEASWGEGVMVRGVRTHYYLENEFFKEKLQSEIMPRLLEDGVVKPNRIRIVEGETLLQRAQAALDALRRKEVSGERLVWRVA